MIDSHSSSGRSKGCRRAGPSSWSEAEDDCVWKSTVLTFSPLSWDLHELVARPLRISHPPSRTSLPSQRLHTRLTDTHSWPVPPTTPLFFVRTTYRNFHSSLVHHCRCLECACKSLDCNCWAAQTVQCSSRVRGVAGSNPRKVKPFGWMKILLSYHYWRSLNLVVWITLMTRSEEKYSP